MNSFATGAPGEPIVTERIIYKTIGENKENGDSLE